MQFAMNSWWRIAFSVINDIAETPILMIDVNEIWQFSIKNQQFFYIRPPFPDVAVLFDRHILDLFPVSWNKDV